MEKKWKERNAKDPEQLKQSRERTKLLQSYRNQDGGDQQKHRPADQRDTTESPEIIIIQ